MREIIFNICIIAIATALFRLLVPENSFRKQIGFLISCFFITAVMSFILNGKWEISDFHETQLMFEYGDYVDYTEQAMSRRKKAIADELSTRIREVLAHYDVYPEKIYTIVNISDTYSISINEIKLVLSPEEDFVLISSLVEKEVGHGIKVTIEL